MVPNTPTFQKTVNVKLIISSRNENELHCKIIKVTDIMFLHTATCPRSIYNYIMERVRKALINVCWQPLFISLISSLGKLVSAWSGASSESSSCLVLSPTAWDRRDVSWAPGHHWSHSSDLLFVLGAPATSDQWINPELCIFECQRHFVGPVKWIWFRAIMLEPAEALLNVTAQHKHLLISKWQHHALTGLWPRANGHTSNSST